MNILICISHVPDTTSKIEFEAGGKELKKAGITFVVGPHDDYAVARAMELREKGIAKKTTVLCVGLAEVEPTIRKALAIGHDDAVRINAEPIDGFVVANGIAEFLRQQPYDLILFGKESINFNSAMVPAMVAELVDLPAVYYANQLDIVNNQVQVRREVDGGTETVTLPMPAIVSCAKGVAEWRIAGLRGITQAKTKQIKVFNPTPAEPMTQSVKFDLPPARQGCQYFGVDDVSKLVEVLATKGAL